MTTVDKANNPLVQFTPVSRDTHAFLRWRRPRDYSHAAQEAIVPIVGSELAHAALSMPIAFVESLGRFMPFAVLSLTPHTNAFVAPHGQWLGGYIPAVFRAYPFRLVRVEGTENYALAVEDAAVVQQDVDPSAESFYDLEGKLAPPVQELADALSAFEGNRAATAIAVQALAQGGIIHPWEIKLKVSGIKDQTVTGLSRIDEVALGRLSDEAFLRLRKASALPFAYAQLLSMGKLGVFESLANIRNQLAQVEPKKPASPAPASLQNIFLSPDNDTLRFD